MDFGHSGDVMKNRTSFGLSVADEKIKLIDILSEDDYFLVDSPICDHHLQSSISDLERMEQKEKSIFFGDSQESRPSFLRRSLAWDSAFFNSSGVLDHDELLFINNGASETSLLPATHEVRNRRSESESTPNDLGFSEDWFELQPSIIESMSSKALNLNVVEGKSSKSGLKPIVQSSRKGDRWCKNKLKSDPTSIGKSINVESEGKMKNESLSRRASASGIKNLSRISSLNTENKSMKTSLGQGLVKEEKSTYKTSSNLQPFTSLSSAKFPPIFSPTTATSSTLSKRKPQLNKTQNSASVSKKWNGNISASTHTTSIFASPANSTRHFQALLSPVHKQRRSVDSKDVKEASNMQSSLQIPKQNGSLSTKTMRPSGLRPPSPRHRFFDESTPQLAERSRKMPQKNLKNPGSESAKRPETMLINTFATTGKSDKQYVKKEAQFPANQLDNLCRNFEAVALESEKVIVKEENKQQPSSRMASSRPSRRTPLADKTSKCNFSAAFASPLMEVKKDKFMRRASSVRYV